MTTARNRSRAVSVLNAHQPDDLNTTATTIRCLCGEDVPRQAEALAVHQVHQLDVLELLAADPTEPLSLLAIGDLGAGEIVFDHQGIAWMNTGDDHGTSDVLWAAWSQEADDLTSLTTEELHVERSPLSMHRPTGPACVSCGCTDDRACPGGCSWASTDPPVCTACVGGRS